MKRCCLTFVVLVLACAIQAGADEGRNLVFSDGATVTVASLTLNGSWVEVELPNGAIQRYEAEHIDLEASGLVEAAAETAEAPAEPAAPKGKFDSAIASGPGDPNGAKITDQDVGHIRPGAAEAEADVEAGDSGSAGRTTSLMVSDLQREQVGPVMKVTGKVSNTGDTPVTAIAITAVAQTGEGETAGKGTTGLSQTLEPGGSAEFSIAVPVEGTASNVRVTASAALTEFKFEEVAAPESTEGEAEGE
ncbi:MAG: FxLYD domain-containing protein [Acidobacteriota bacterium]